MAHKRVTVEDLMTTSVIALKASESVERLREEMENATVNHIPVVDDHNHVIGIVSDRDLLRKRGARVADVMSKRVLTVTRSTTASEAAAIMIAERIHALPVIGAEEQLVGMITAADFLAVAERALSGRDPAGREG
jgi:CBS domain-containing protein